MTFKILCFAFIFAMTINVFSQMTLEPGVSRELAKWRAANYSDVRYKLNITLEKQAPLMKGTIEIRVNLTEEGAKNDLILDWRTTQFQNDKDKPYAHVTSLNGQTPLVIEAAEHLRISRQFLKTGENVLNIEFASPIKTSGAAVTRYVDKEDGAEYIYSLFVPSDASTAFPVFDQPDLKARFKLNLNLPIGWTAVSNTKSKEFFANVNGRGVTNSFTLADFEETKPISTYVFAFAAGDFAEFNEGGNPTVREGAKSSDNSNDKTSAPLLTRGLLPLNIYVRKSQAEKFKQHAAEVFRLNREGVKFLESWFDYKFPFSKYDLVLIPEFPFGGMEHAGATFLREDRVIFPTEPTKNDYITRANVIFHEAAHQWFGDTVTMRWFDDLWLKEGFAEFMAYKTLEKVMPEYNAWKVFYERNKQAAYLTDVTRGTTPIYQEIPNLSAAKSAYGNIVYRKAPSFLRQAEFYLGEKEFQTAVRAFLKKHEFANATWQDLLREFETVGKSAYIRDFSEAWVKQRGLFKIRLIKDEYINSKNKLTLVADEQHSIDQFPERVMKFKVLVVNENGTKIIRDFELNPTRSSFRDNFPLSENPALIFPNYQDYGYGIFLLDEQSRAYVLENIQNEKDDFLRSMMWGSLWDSVRFYELAPEEYVRLVIKNINVEQDESTIATLLNRVSTAMNYYINEGGNPRVSKGAKNERSTLPNGRVSANEELTPEIENLLIEKMQNAPTLGERITFYRSFVALASTEDAHYVLKSLLKGVFENKGGNPTVKEGANPKSELQILRAGAPMLTRGLPPLKAKDKFDIVTKLITLGDAEGLKLLAELEKTYTDDAAKRYAYAARAGIPTAENKAKYWNDFINNKEISESYIESAFAVWNTPRHSDLTLPYLERALAELPNLKKNRKIFFVNGWLGAFIGGQKSEAALNIVNKFLADNPNLDKDLRLKILENEDNLERAVKIRAKFGK